MLFFAFSHLQTINLFSEGRGGASIYGKEFDDEIHSDLKHTGEIYHYSVA